MVILNPYPRANPTPTWPEASLPPQLALLPLPSRPTLPPIYYVIIIG